MRRSVAGIPQDLASSFLKIALHAPNVSALSPCSSDAIYQLAAQYPDVSITSTSGTHSFAHHSLKPPAWIRFCAPHLSVPWFEHMQSHLLGGCSPDMNVLLVGQDTENNRTYEQSMHLSNTPECIFACFIACLPPHMRIEAAVARQQYLHTPAMTTGLRAAALSRLLAPLRRHTDNTVELSDAASTPTIPCGDATRVSPRHTSTIGTFTRAATHRAPRVPQITAPPSPPQCRPTTSRSRVLHAHSHPRTHLAISPSSQTHAPHALAQDLTAVSALHSAHRLEYTSSSSEPASPLSPCRACFPSQGSGAELGAWSDHRHGRQHRHQHGHQHGHGRRPYTAVFAPPSAPPRRPSDREIEQRFPGPGAYDVTLASRKSSTHSTTPTTVLTARRSIVQALGVARAPQVHSRRSRAERGALMREATVHTHKRNHNHREYRQADVAHYSEQCRCSDI